MEFRIRGYHPLWQAFPTPFPLTDRFANSHVAGPYNPVPAIASRRFEPVSRSLATTEGVSMDLFSSRYLDVSVPWVPRLKHLCIQCKRLTRGMTLEPGFPIRRSLGSTLA